MRLSIVIPTLDEENTLADTLPTALAEGDEVVVSDGGSRDPTRELARALIDRFGELPAPMINLLQVFLLKHVLLQHGVLGVQFTGEDRIVVRHPQGQPLGGAWLDRFADVRPVEAGKTHLIFPRRKKPWDGDSVLAFTLESLLGTANVTKMRTAWRRKRRSRSS